MLPALASAVIAIAVRGRLFVFTSFSLGYVLSLTVRYQLLTFRMRPSLDEAMPELLAEETRLPMGGVSRDQ